MVPLGRTTTSRKKTRGGRKPTRSSHSKIKQHPQREKHEQFSANCSSISSNDSSKDRDMDSEVAEDVSTSVCSTPKGQKFRIPEISTCPPAPKKQKVRSNCSLRRPPLAFFAPPDLEIFFGVALRDVPVSFVC